MSSIDASVARAKKEDSPGWQDTRPEGGYKRPHHDCDPLPDERPASMRTLASLPPGFWVQQSDPKAAAEARAALAPARVSQPSRDFLPLGDEFPGGCSHCGYWHPEGWVPVVSSDGVLCVTPKEAESGQFAYEDGGSDKEPAATILANWFLALFMVGMVGLLVFGAAQNAGWVK